MFISIHNHRTRPWAVGATEASARLPGHPGNLRNGPGGAPGILGRSPGAVEAKK